MFRFQGFKNWSILGGVAGLYQSEQESGTEEVERGRAEEERRWKRKRRKEAARQTSASTNLAGVASMKLLCTRASTESSCFSFLQLPSFLFLLLLLFFFFYFLLPLLLLLPLCSAQNRLVPSGTDQYFKPWLVLVAA